MHTPYAGALGPGIPFGEHLMQVARHPESNKCISVKEYVFEFGKPTANDPDYRPPPCSCVACRDAVYLRPHVPSPDVRQHFAHKPGGMFCPTKTRAGAPYLNLRPTKQDPVAAQILKNAFRINWKRHYSRLASGPNCLLPLMSIKEFFSMLEGADKADVWGHVGMTEVDLPYVLVLTRDFPPWTGLQKDGKPLRRLWFRFWFDHRIRQLPDLWIRAPHDLQIQRASFIAPPSPRGRPVQDDLVHVTDLPVTGDFLRVEEPQLHDWVVRQVEDWFARHWQR